MKTGMYIALALVLGALLANVLLADPGYVALRFAGYLVEMSAVTFVLVLVVAYFVIRLLIKAVQARRLWRKAQEERRHERARRSLARGLLELSEGDWAAAEDTMTRAARAAEVPAAHYLVAARAAELQGSAQRRDQWLAKALEASPEKRAPALVMQAEILLKHKQLQAALATLEQLEASGESNARSMLLLARIHRQTGDWEKLQALEPRLRATRGISTAVADETVAQIYLDRLKDADASADPERLDAAWREMPKSLARRPPLVVAYARAAMACRNHPAAETELRELIEKQWDEAAVLAYGELQMPEPFAVLDRAESWLGDHPEDPSLLLSCARLCIRAELYGKARSYLETSLAIRPRLEAYQLLATLLEQLGERDRALKALNDGLVHAIGRRPDVPRIRLRRWAERRQTERRGRP